MTDIRRRRRRRRGRRSSNLRQRTRKIGAGLSLAAGTLLIINPLATLVGRAAPWPVRIEMAAGQQFQRNLANWFIFDNGALVIGVLLVLAGLATALSIWRNAVIGDRSLWDTKCPRCANPSLKRRRRERPERLAGLFGVPVRRYSCPACAWTGARVESDLVSQ